MVSVLILLGTCFSISDAKAETIHMYVEKMPQHWQKQFGGILDEAVQYWEGRMPNLTFDTVPYVDRANFVVEWASQYDEGKLGYYSADTSNAYGKPTMAITLGFFKDKKWYLVQPEYALQVTKHELGHAIGMPYSDDPNDIMYPTIENYESWQQDLEQNPQDSPKNSQTTANASTNWQSESEKYQRLASDKILPLDSKITDTKSLLASLSYKNKASQDVVDDAWTAFWWAKKYLDSAEKMQTDGGALVLQSNYQDSSAKFKSSCDFADKVEQKLEQITKYIEKADSLEFGNK
jgi:hypothetical protein